MSTEVVRARGRKANQLRSFTTEQGVLQRADGSGRYRMGNFYY